MPNTHAPIVGVICELNPLHNGHVHLLSRARQWAGEGGCVVCVMSGRTTQRGECAIADPFVRGRMALSGGADLVVELPFPWSSGSAESFARAGVHILSSLGADRLLFGSECGDMDLLARCAALLATEAFTETYAALCREGQGTAAAYTEALRALCPDLPQSFPASNDLLGLAYLSALQGLGADMTAHTIRRQGQGYLDEILTDAAFPSATALRRLISEAACDPHSLSVMLDGTMPREALELLLAEIKEERAPVTPEALHSYYHTLFRMADDESALADTAEMRGGLIGHLHKCALAAATPQAFMASVATKQYTNARLRRGMLFAATGVLEEDLRALPVYTQVLAANGRGRAHLSRLKKVSDAPTVQIVTKPAHAPTCRQRGLGERADALFTLCMPCPKEAGWLCRQGPYMK